MAKVICFGISKGGCAKSTSAGISAFLLSKQARVLCVDMDSQGNLSSFLTGEEDICEAFDKKTILEAIKEADVRPYIVKVSNNLDLVPSNDFLSLLPRWLYQEYRGSTPNLVLRDALIKVMDEYDYIIIDTPPSLSELTTTSLAAAEHVVIMFDGSRFCYFAIDKFLEICGAVRDKDNPDLSISGILFSIVDTRTSDTKAMITLVDQEYESLRFNTIIQRKAATKRLPIYGLNDNPELASAVEGYIPFIEELMSRV
ncbi:ParA family protein [Paenibacillus humicola]|uniref:ParA family protein n=1 Tax=Paenibacillus humicola TaxID=3110540 RepID=UPI00237B972A|nr:ParA family protein [Paenibacillus humicola]